MQRNIPDEVLSAGDGDRHGVAESVELNLSVFLEQLLAEEDVEVLVSLVRNVDDVWVFPRGLGGCGFGDGIHLSLNMFCFMIMLI